MLVGERSLIEWGTVAWKARPIAVGQAKRWWNRDEAKNLSRRVLAELERDPRITVGIREDLVWQWESVRGDATLARVVAHLLIDPEPAIEPLVEVRLVQLLEGLPLKLGVQETAARLASAVLGQLGAAHKTQDAVAQAEHRRTHNKLDDLKEQLQDLARPPTESSVHQRRRCARCAAARSVVYWPRA